MLCVLNGSSIPKTYFAMNSLCESEAGAFQILI